MSIDNRRCVAGCDRDGVLGGGGVKAKVGGAWKLGGAVTPYGSHRYLGDESERQGTGLWVE